MNGSSNNLLSDSVTSKGSLCTTLLNRHTTYLHVHRGISMWMVMGAVPVRVRPHQLPCRYISTMHLPEDAMHCSAHWLATVPHEGQCCAVCRLSVEHSPLIPTCIIPTCNQLKINTVFYVSISLCETVWLIYRKINTGQCMPVLNEYSVDEIDNFHRSELIRLTTTIYQLWYAKLIALEHLR